MREYCRKCPVCGEVEETCDCSYVDDIAAHLCDGPGLADVQVERMIELLEEQGLLAHRDGGGWMLAEMTDEQFQALTAEACS